MRVGKGQSLAERTGVDEVFIHGTGPGLAVCFRDSSAITDRLPAATALPTPNGDGRQAPAFRSIEFLVRACTASSCSGPVLSYAQQQTFTLRVESGRLVVTLGSERHDSTTLVLEEERWNQVGVVAHEAGRLDVYVTDSQGVVSRDSLPLQAMPFPAGGQLALGRWQPSTSGSGDQPLRGFQGCVDELRLWKEPLANVEIASHWNVSRTLTAVSLHSQSKDQS